jgi:hypothetical protein
LVDICRIDLSPQDARPTVLIEPRHRHSD